MQRQKIDNTAGETMPKRQIKSQIINARWEAILPAFKNETVDLIYTDPPYGMNYKSNIAGDKQWNKEGKPRNRVICGIQNDGYADISWADFARQCYRILKDDTYMFLHCNIYVIAHHVIHFEQIGFKIAGCAVWSKGCANGGDLYGSMSRDWEPLIYFKKGNPKMNSIMVTRNGQRVLRNRISETEDWQYTEEDVGNTQIENDKEHSRPKTELYIRCSARNKDEFCGVPTQKPLKLCRQVILLASKPGDLVLDAFAGSGSIPFAAKELQRRYIAIEADDKVAELCSKRLGQKISEKIRL